MDLNELAIFVRVVQAGSIRAAAQQMGIPKSTVSRKLMDLEARLDARLIQRSTRKLGLTDSGRLFFDHGLRIVNDLENAERAVRSQHEAPRGLLRVTAPLNLAFFGPIISSYLALYPDVRVEMSANARVVDLIDEGFDVGIRMGVLDDSSLIARPLGTVDWVLAATPNYLDRRGRPETPADLKQHDCLLFGQHPTVVLIHQGQIHTDGASTGQRSVEKLSLAPRLLSTDMDVLDVGMRNGLGIATLPEFRCQSALQEQGLERVLPKWRPPSTPIQIVYPSRRHLSPTVRSFMDHVQAGVAQVLGERQADAQWQD